ncbi:Uncharacterised protein [uncultured archaeon]|nr:Uncharacterised protein [uncultured archaeon]
MEITCPDTGGVVQIDATPWYFGINPGHTGGEENNFVAGSMFFLDRVGAPPFAIKEYGDKFIAIYVSGYAPRLAGDGASSPEYTFCLGAVVESGCGREESLQLFVDVRDSARLQEIFSNGSASLGEILESGAVKLELAGYALGCRIPLAHNHGPSLKMLEMASQVLGEDNENEKYMAEFLLQNIPRLIPLLRKATPQLRMFNNEAETVDVRTALSDGAATKLRLDYLMRSMNVLRGGAGSKASSGKMEWLHEPERKFFKKEPLMPCGQKTLSENPFRKLRR